jgi:hypothetical protein
LEVVPLLLLLLLRLLRVEIFKYQRHCVDK